LLAEMDEKSSRPSAIASPVVESPASASPTPGQSSDASPATSYAGKFDPKSIAKKAAQVSKANGAPLGAFGAKDGPPKLAAKESTKAPGLPANRGNISSFGFQKQGDKLAGKRKLDL